MTDPLDSVSSDEPSSFVADLIELHLDAKDRGDVTAAIKYMRSHRSGDDGPSLAAVCREWLMMQYMTEVWLPQPDAYGDYVYTDGAEICPDCAGNYFIWRPWPNLMHDDLFTEFATPLAAALRMMELGIGPAVCKKPARTVNRPAPETVVEAASM